MTWSLVARTSDEAHTISHALQPKRTSCIALEKGLDTVLVVDQYSPELRAGGLRTLARISIAGWGVKLEALRSLAVEPANPRSSEHITPNHERYKLDASGRTEVIFLRENDTVYFQDAGPTINVKLKYTASEVQVDSSIAADAEIPESVDPGILPPPAEQDETDNEDLDRTITVSANLSNGRRSEATPMPSLSRSEVVQETPTANRSYMATELSDGHKTVNNADDVNSADADEGDDPNDVKMDASYAAEHQDGHTDVAAPGLDLHSVPKVEATDDSPQDAEPTTVNELAEQGAADSGVPTSTTLSGNKSLFGDGYSKGKIDSQHSSVRGSQRATGKDAQRQTDRKNKRTLDDDEGDTAETTTPRTKRAKRTPSGTQGSARSTGKRHPSVSSIEVKTLVNESREISTVSDSDLIWEDDPPKVAFSNSGADMPNLKAFIRSRGGDIVEKIKDLNRCNLLCIRDGQIRKSIKLLACIALGIRIVTDKWLTDSAHRKKFMNPEDYIPKVPKQEKELGFSLREVWGKPQDHLLDGYTVYFTTALAKTYQDFAEVAHLIRFVGASKVHQSARYAGGAKAGDKVIFFGLDDEDVECAALLKGGCTVYSRDTLASSILRGGIDLESEEFKIQTDGSASGGTPIRSTPKRGNSPRVVPKKRGRPAKT